MAEDEHRTCARCGSGADQVPGGLPPGWTLVTDAAGTRSLCATCTRTNVRAIEARLDETWWEG